ncbi:MAG: polysaccharide biosynthesis protein [Chlorobi bacterium]|nr:polysaccharide biosynthesis protein [Chlorobiota bacterium]
MKHLKNKFLHPAKHWISHQIGDRLKTFLIKSSPRWLVFLIDLMLATVAFWFAYFVRFNFSFKFISDAAWYQWLLFLGVNAVFFWIFKPYVGVIRHTGWKDVDKIFRACFFTAVVLWGVTVMARKGYLPRTWNYPYSIIFLSTVFELAFLAGARLLYKAMYYKIVRSNRKPLNVLIYGTGMEAIQVAELLQNNPDYKFNIKGFVSKEPQKAKYLRGIPIIPVERVDEQFLRDRLIDRVIIAEPAQNPLNVLEISNRFAYPGIRVHTVPPPNRWMNNILRYEDIREFDLEALLERPPIPRDDEGIFQSLEGKTVWVTGAAGSIGSELSRQILHYNPAKVYLIDQAETPLYELELELRRNGKDQFVPVLADIFDFEHVDRLFEEHTPNIIFHAAAYKHVPVLELQPYYGIAVNILATKHLMERAGQYGVEKFIQISTDKAVNPTNVMGATKRVAELMARCMQEKYPRTQYIVTRFGNVLGSNGSVIHLFKKQIREGGPVTVTHPDINRFFMTIPEAAHLVLKAAQIGRGGQIYVFDMGKPVKIVDLAVKMIRLSGKRYPEDIRIEFTGLRPGEKISEEILTAKEMVENRVHEKLFISKLSPLDCKRLEEKLARLQEVFDRFDMNGSIKVIKEIVPEYKSNHSRFEALD